MKIKLKTKTEKKFDAERLRVRVIKAPVVDKNDLNHVLSGRAKAIVL